MRRLLPLLLAAACSKPGAPAIASFSVDKPAAFTGDVVTFSWQVTGADTLSLDPGLGTVTGQGAQAVVQESTTFVLTAANEHGKTARPVTVAVQPRPPPPLIQGFAASPSQAPAGSAVTLRWSVAAATGVTIDQSPGAGQALGPQPATGSVVVHPAANTLYTLTATGAPGAVNPPPVQAMFRVAVPPSITRFDADATSVTQGQGVTLSWRGTASSWSVFDGATTVSLGPVTSLRVTPSPPRTTYTLTGTSATGTIAQAREVAVAAAPATSLSFAAPAPAAADALAFRLGAGSTPALAVLELVTLRALSARALAIDLPLDASKVTLDPSSLSVNRAAIDPGSPLAARVVLGRGRLANTLVLGIAARATGGVPAADASLPAGTVVASFSLGVRAAGGPGTVWDASRPARAALRSAAAASVPISLAAGMLVTQ